MYEDRFTNYLFQLRDISHVLSTLNRSTNFLALARDHSADYALYVRNGMQTTPLPFALVEYLDFLIFASTGKELNLFWLIDSSPVDLDIK